MQFASPEDRAAFVAKVKEGLERARLNGVRLGRPPLKEAVKKERAAKKIVAALKQAYEREERESLRASLSASVVDENQTTTTPPETPQTES